MLKPYAGDIKSVFDNMDQNDAINAFKELLLHHWEMHRQCMIKYVHIAKIGNNNIFLGKLLNKTDFIELSLDQIYDFFDTKLSNIYFWIGVSYVGRQQKGVSQGQPLVVQHCV